MLRLIKNILTAFVMISIIVSCVEEPTIAPAPSPFTQIRFGNLTANISGLDFYVEQKKVAANVQQNTFSSFEIYTSGDRTFEVRDAATDSVLYNKKLGAVSYEELSVFGIGYYDQNIDSTSFDVVKATEGFTYIKEDVPDSLTNAIRTYIFDGVGATPTEDEWQLKITYINMDDSTAKEGTISTLDGELIKVGEVGVTTLTENNFSFTVIGVDLKQNEQTLFTFTHQLTLGKRNYVYLSGAPSDIKVGFEELAPLEALDK